MFAEVDQGRVVVDVGTVHHAAVAVVGVFAEAGVRHHDHVRHGVLDDRGHARDQAALFPGVAAVGVQVVGHAEGHHRLDPGTGITLDFTGQFFSGIRTTPGMLVIGTKSSISSSTKIGSTRSLRVNSVS